MYWVVCGTVAAARGPLDSPQILKVGYFLAINTVVGGRFQAVGVISKLRLAGVFFNTFGRV